MASITASMTGELASLGLKRSALFQTAASSASRRWSVGGNAFGTKKFASSVAGRPLSISRTCYENGHSALAQAGKNWKQLGRNSLVRCSSGATAGTEGADENLAKKKCVPCEAGSGIETLPAETATALLSKVPGWEIHEENGVPRLRHMYKVKNFLKGLELFQKVADVAEAEGHHPDLHLEGWNNAKIEIWTHSIGGLHMNDFVLAAKINELDKEDFLKKKKKSLATSPPVMGV